jgi:hypothetical protein
MPKLGGQATITGIDFEAWFVALKFVDAFFDENLEVTPQAQTYKNPKTQKIEITAIDDIYIHFDSKKEFYNLKFRAPTIRSWTINLLHGQKVLKQFKDQFMKSPDSSLYFVTQSPCPIFAEVLLRGASCTSREELEISLRENNYIKEWDKLQKLLGFSDDNMISFAKQIKFKPIIDIEEVEKSIKYRLHGHVTEFDFAPKCLYQLAIEAGKNSRTITRKDIIEYLEKNNIYLKSHLKIEELLEKLRNTSANLHSIRHKIENVHIEREEVNTLVNWIHTPLKEEESPIAVLTGKAGCGKTVIQRDLLIKIQRENIPVLGIKTDLLMFDTLEALSNEIGLSDGIMVTMATIVEKYGKGVVLFDQVDALSLALAKDRKSINTYFNLINQLSGIKGIRIILSCRSFDLKYDPILKSLENKYTVDVKELSDKQVDKVLIKLGIERKKISNRLLDLLRTPLHLKIFCDIYNPDDDLISINTLHNLYNELYNQKILKIFDSDIREDVFKAIDIMIDKMDNSKVLTVPLSLLDRNSQGVNYLSSQSIVLRYNNKIQFFHSSFFDYCYARTFLSRHDSLIRFVISQHQGLFIRPQVKQVLAYLRDSDFSTYLKELKEFLVNHKVRFHIRLLVINQLAFLKNPKDEEWSIVRQLLEKDDNFKKHFMNGIQSERWLEYLISSGCLRMLLQSGNEKIINIIIGKLRILINFYTKTIVSFLQRFPNIRKKDEYVVQVLIGLEHWEDEKAIRLFQSHLQVIKGGYSFNYSHFLLRILEFKPEVVCKIFFDDIYEKINAVRSKDEFDRRQFFSHYDIEIFKKLLNWNSDVVLPKLLQLIHTMVDKTKWKSETDFFSDSAFYGYEQFEPDLYPHWQVLSLVLEKLKELAINDKSKFTKLVKGFEKSHSFTLLKIVLHGYNANSELYIEEGFKLFCRKGILENVTSNLEAGFKLRSLIRNIYPHFSKTQKEKINKLILSVLPYWEKDREKGQQSLIGYTRYKLLNAIPDDEISKHPIMKKEFQELERKFGKLKEKPIKIGRSKGIGPPLPPTAYEEMTQEQWLSSFRRYDETTSWGMPREEPLKGGIIENSRAFAKQVSKRPDKFYDFVFGLGKTDDVSITYLGSGLEGLIKGNYDVEKIKKLVKTYWSYKDTEFRKDIIRAIEYIDQKVNLDLDLIEILAEYALNDPDPKEELWETDAYQGTPSYGGDPHSQGINSVRGSATERLVIHGFETQYSEKIFKILNKIAEDKSVAVRCCLIRHLQGMIKWNKNKTFKLFKKITSDKHPQVIKYGLECLSYLMNKNNFRIFIFYLEKAIILKETFDHNSVGKFIGQILVLAYLRSYSKSKELLEKGYKVNEEIKMGAIGYASRHLSSSNTKIADKSKKIYMKFFHEADDKMSQQYDFYFRHFKVEDFIKIYTVILEYSKTEIVRKHCTNFFEFLAKVVSLEPEKCISILQNYKNFESPEIRYNDLQGKLVQILIEAYNRVIDDTYKEKAMNVFDAILQVGVYTREALEVLAEQDRG